VKLFIDGELREASPSEPAALAPDDGAGLLEIVRVRRARIELEREHARRLLASAPALSLAPAPTRSSPRCARPSRRTAAATACSR
jgi:branched-subunit amino acid aminotransferase/4-amino-4-deoxychorismate lyase